MTKAGFADPRYPPRHDGAPSDRDPRAPEPAAGPLLADAALADAALAAMVRRYRAAIHAAAFRILRDFHAAEDVTQETFLIAYRKAGDVREPKALGGWLRRVAVSRCHRVRRRQRAATVPLGAAAAAASPELDPCEMVQRREDRRAVLAAVRSLPEHQRTAVRLFYLDGLSQREAAGRLDVPCTTVKKRLHDARLKLKQRLTADAAGSQS